MFSEVDYESEAKKYRNNSLVLIVIAMFIPVVSYSSIFKPDIDSVEVWFQRSGALIVFVASVAEYHAFKIISTFTPARLAKDPDISIKIKYSDQAHKLIYFAATIIGFGTIIWGYGDLFYQ